MYLKNPYRKYFVVTMVNQWYWYMKFPENMPKNEVLTVHVQNMVEI